VGDLYATLTIKKSCQKGLWCLLARSELLFAPWEKPAQVLGPEIVALSNLIPSMFVFPTSKTDKKRCTAHHKSRWTAPDETEH